MRADRFGFGARRAQLVLLGERQRFDRLEAAGRLGGPKIRRREFLPIEAGMREEIADLPAVERAVEGALLFPRPGLGLRVENHGASLPPS